MQSVKEAEAVSTELRTAITGSNPYPESDGKHLANWDRVFFGKKRPDTKCEKTCACGSIMEFYHAGIYITGQWQCVKCTRLFGATVAETIGGLLALLERARELED